MSNRLTICRVCDRRMEWYRVWVIDGVFLMGWVHLKWLTDELIPLNEVKRRKCIKSRVVLYDTRV